MPLNLPRRVLCSRSPVGFRNRQVEVNYALPDRTLTISRPPKNRLPVVDFSYRPLFACLSVENILCVVGLLLTEAKVGLDRVQLTATM